jgi:hypothetical protein
MVTFSRQLRDTESKRSPENDRSSQYSTDLRQSSILGSAIVKIDQQSTSLGMDPTVPSSIADIRHPHGIRTSSQFAIASGMSLSFHGRAVAAFIQMTSSSLDLSKQD